jgi:hypothetical protein
MADLSVTIGLDQKELEKGLAGAGKSIGNMGGGAGKNPFSESAKQFSTMQGIGGMIGGPIGGLVGAFFDAFGGMLSAALSKVKEIADYAQSIRLAALTTGLGIDKIRHLEAIGQAFGVSLNTMSRSVVEFTRRMGEARIKGGEVTNILAKMGVGMDELQKGSFDATKAMKLLADAHAAGTDEATLLYYGTKLFGDSFKELLPIIKAGSRAIEDASRSYYNAGKEETSAAGRLGNMMDNLWRSAKNMAIDLVGGFHAIMEDLAQAFDNLLEPGFWNPFEKLEDKIKRQIRTSPKYMTNEELRERILKFYPQSEREAAAKELDKQLKGKGKVLSPFGMSEAGAASQMQQMGGGDIFGAVAFSPMERIATATEETAKNTRPDITPSARTPDELSR